MERKDIVGLLFFLMSVLVLADTFLFMQKSLETLFANKSLFILFISIFIIISIVVVTSYERSIRFIYLFWNTVFAGIIGSASFKTLISESSTILKMFCVLLLVYSIIVIFSMSQIAKHAKKWKKFSIIETSIEYTDKTISAGLLKFRLQQEYSLKVMVLVNNFLANDKIKLQEYNKKS